jgi:hypothetical protein
MVPSPRRLPHTISALEQSGFELSVPLALKLVVSRKRELDGGILIGDDDGMIP